MAGIKKGRDAVDFNSEIRPRVMSGLESEFRAFGTNDLLSQARINVLRPPAGNHGSGLEAFGNHVFVER
jgi:hypothetical protein